MNKEIVEYLSQFVTEKRLATLNEALSNRTRYFTVALEDIYQSHNASAVLRTCDCFGFQDVHIIENKNEYKINPDVALGSSKWLNLNRYNANENNTLEAINKLKSQGYRIVATTPHTNDVSLNDFDVNKGKAALFFGTELEGLSDLMLEHADEYLKIPMYGFTESFNISVSAALVMHHLNYKLRKSDVKWQLTEEEINEIKFNWLKSSIKKSDLLISEFQNK